MEIKVGINETDLRVDKLVKRMLPQAPLSFIYKMFRKKDVKVNNKKVDITYKLKKDDIVSIYITDLFLKKFQTEKVSIDKKISEYKFNIDIIYEDDNICIVNKPRGLLVHEDEGNTSSNLQKKFIRYLQSKNEYDPSNETNFVPGPVHRLDRNTSGICILAKNLMATHELLELFKVKDEIEKTYLALVCGVADKHGTIDIPLIKNSKTKRVTPCPIEKGGKTAITKYKRIKNYGDVSLVEVELLTGRTHQIRVHFQSIKHPIVGDAKYGDLSVNKFFSDVYRLKDQFLHAYKFSFKDVKGELSYLSGRTFIAKLPDSLQHILDNIKL